MKRILDIAHKDLYELSRNRMTFLFLLIMPVIFTLLFGFAFSGAGGSEADPRLPVACLDQDGSALSTELKNLLAESGVIRLVEEPGANADDLEQQVTDGDLAALVIVPEGYGAALLAGTPVRVTVFVDGSTPAGLTVESDLLAAANRLASATRTARIVAEAAGDPSLFEAALAQTLSAWENPPVRLAVTAGAAQVDDEETYSAFSHTSPAMMLQFAIAGLLTAATVIVNERKTRCLQRLLTTATSRLQILLGHYLAIVTLLLAQFAALIVFGQILLGLDYFAQPLASLLVTVTTALCIGGLGLLIGTLAKSEEQAIMFSLIPMFILSGLGGAWVPLEVTGPTFQAIGHLSPVAWAMDGFENITARGLGLGSALVPAAMLVGYALLFIALAAWRFHASEER